MGEIKRLLEMPSRTHLFLGWLILTTIGMYIAYLLTAIGALRANIVEQRLQIIFLTDRISMLSQQDATPALESSISWVPIFAAAAAVIGCLLLGVYFFSGSSGTGAPDVLTTLGIKNVDTPLHASEPYILGDATSYNRAIEVVFEFIAAFETEEKLAPGVNSIPALDYVALERLILAGNFIVDTVKVFLTGS